MQSKYSQLLNIFSFTSLLEGFYEIMPGSVDILKSRYCQKLLLTCIFFLPGITLQSQINNLYLESHYDLNDSIQKQILLNIESNSFFKNNEYFGNISTGYTLFGTRLAAQVAYLPNPNVRLQTGVVMQRDFGNDTFLRVIPVFTCKIQKNGYSVLLGALEGTFAHRLIEPLFNYERFITNPVENGLQIKIDKEGLWSDTWINWDVMQYLGDRRQEQFTVGHHSDIVLLKRNRLKISIPLQATVKHTGGQIDVDTTPLKTISNAAVGFVFQYNSMRRSDFLKSFRSENYYCLFSDLSPAKRLNFQQGDALFLNATFTTKYDIALSAGYWNGNGYLSSVGGYLFQSEASPYGKPGFVQPNRNLLFFRLLYQHRVFDAVNIDVRFEPYYDFGSAIFEYNYGVYFSYKNDFTLFNFLKRK